MPWLPAIARNAAGSIGSNAYNAYKAIPLLHHGVSAVLSWPWRRRIIHNIIHRHVRYKVTVECVPGQLICGRCNEVPSVPKKTSCGKTICRKCAGYNNQCPFCNNGSCVASHCLEYAQQISKLRAKCPTPQCGWYGKVEEVKEHLQQCADATVTCPQCATRVLRKLQFKHKDCCPFQIKNCFYCRKEGYAKDIIIHEEKECPLRKVECPNGCGDLDIFHDKLEAHLQEWCPLRRILCERCNKVYDAEDMEQHPCVPSIMTQSTNLVPKPSNHNVEMTAVYPECPSSSVDSPSMKGNSPFSSNPSLQYPITTPVTIPIAEYTTQDNSKSKAEVLQRLAVSCITLSLLSTIAYLRSQRLTDVQFIHDMEVPSVLLWGIFTSTVAFLVILAGSSCYMNLFKAINARECIAIALAISFIHLIRFYPNASLSIIPGSLCGSTFKIYLFYKYVTTHPGQFTNTLWVMTQFVAIVLAPFIIVYYSSISNLRVAAMLLVYIVYITVLREKQQIEICWNNMTQENRAVVAYLVNGLVLFLMMLYSIAAISYELFSTNSISLKIIFTAVLPLAYFYIMGVEEVQDKMLELGEKLYKSSIYSFWGRLCMVSIFYYTMTICLIIPIVQETGDFAVGGALTSVLIVYSIIVQTGLFSKHGVEQILTERTETDDLIKWHVTTLTDVTHNLSALLKVRFVETEGAQSIASPNASTLTLFAELERITSINDTKKHMINQTSLQEATTDDLVAYTLSFSLTNEHWTSANETISFSSQHFFRPMTKNRKLGSACLELSKWERYVNNENAITLDVQLNY